MVQIEVYKNMRDVRVLWERLYNNSPIELTPFSSYAYNYNSLQNLFWRFRGYLFKPLFFHCIEDENEALFLLVRNKKKHTLSTMPVYTPVDYSEVLTNTTNLSFLKQAILKIQEINSGYSIQWNSIHDGSLLYMVLSSLPAYVENCVKIEVDSYEKYFSNLSKHQRQNIRTMYNRLASRNISHCLNLYETQIPCEVAKDYRRLLFHRALQRIQARNDLSLKSKFIMRYNALAVRFKNAIIPSGRQNKDIIIFQYCLASKPVAYISGMYSVDKKTFYISQLAGDRKYSEYSPGILMLNEVIKLLLEKGVTTIDITRGDEPYKLAMGGTLHYNYSYTLDSDNLNMLS